MNAPSRGPHIFFSVGEPSGDLHAANLIRSMQKEQPNLRCVGYGGPLMREAGCELHEELTKLAVMWFARVLANIHIFLGLLFQANRYFREQRPDAVVLVDYPGFNWWIARRAKAHGIPVFYYCPPQVWAWARWRVKKMQRYVDHVLCGLPFEQQWYAERGCHATLVGHPFFDEVRSHRGDEAFIQAMREQPGPLVALLPGSRNQEVQHNLHWFLKAAALIRQQVPDVRFAIASFKDQQAIFAQEKVAESGLPVEVFVGRTPELMQAATCCLAVSGSVSLELMYHEKPTIVLYWISKIGYRAQAIFRKVRYITLVNLLASRDPFALPTADGRPPADEPIPFPEHLTYGDPSAEIAQQAVHWLTDADSRQRCVAQLQHLKAAYAAPGASERAAQYVLETLSPRPTHATIPAPHLGRTPQGTPQERI